MDDIARFLLEMGVLKNVKRSGWWMAGVKDPETVAEHSHRTAIIGYFLAKKEGADAERVMKMCLFHDIAEARVNDLHKVGQRYIDHMETEKKVLEEQFSSLPKDISKELMKLMKEFHEGKTKESIIAKDADYLENAIQAKEYRDAGYKLTEEWMENIRKMLKTNSAKEILDKVSESSENWWKGLKKLD